MPTGIEGFDRLSCGGLPLHRTSLLIGGPGSGKSVFALQCLVNAVRRQRAAGIFVAFEESPRSIIANGATFDWGLHSLSAKKLFFLDAHLSPTLVKAGDFDLAGMLVLLNAKAEEIDARWIVFDGIDVLLTLLEDPVAERREIGRHASSERISVGFESFDALLGGGLFRSTSTLIAGSPGTAKTTLAGKFAEAACLRGERTLFVSYDEGALQIARNLSSVGIQLEPHVESGQLLMYSARPEGIDAEEQLLKVRSLIKEHRPRCVVIDPLTAISKAGRLDAARAVANRLIYSIKDQGITLLVTALSMADDPRLESTDLQISTIADTWIHLSYVVLNGERNRALTIVKSRGTAHSNQVRELVLGESGPTLADVYRADGEVLVGTLRRKREAEETAKEARHHGEFELRRRELQFAAAKTSTRIEALEMDLQQQRAELTSYSGDPDVQGVSATDRKNQLRMRRGGTAGRSSTKAGKGRGK